MGRLFGSELTLITVLPESARKPEPVGALTESEGEGAAQGKADAGSDASSYVEGVAKELRQSGVDANCVTLVNPDAATEIVLTARESKSQLIVMASRGRSGLVRGLLGSVTDRVIHSSPIPVMVAPAGDGQGIDQWSPRSVIVPLDGSELAESALPSAESISRAADAVITLMRAVPFPMMYGGDPYGGVSTELIADAGEDEKAAKQYLAEVATRLRARGHEVKTHVGSGHPRSEIAQIAQEMSDAMVVMTTRGASGLTRWVLGSVADGVIRSSGVPVLVIPPGIGR